MADRMINSEFKQAIVEFNSGNYYACHDILESLWMDALDPDRRFYQGLLQIAVGFYHLSHSNWRGCVILLGEGISKLDDFCPTYAGIDLTPFVSSCMDTLQQLQDLGPENSAFLKMDPLVVTWLETEA